MPGSISLGWMGWFNALHLQALRRTAIALGEP